MDHAGAMTGMMNRNFIRSQCSAYKELILEHQPDFIVDFWNPFACIAAKITKKPLITVIQANAHPANKGLIWWKKPEEKIPTALPAINSIMSEYNLKTLQKSEDLNLGDLTLIIGTPETDPLPPNSPGKYIGAVLWEKESEQLPDWFGDLDDGKPIVWIYSGNPKYSKKATVVDSEIILKTCLEAFENDDYNIVLTTGHHPLPEQYLPLPEHFNFAAYVPGLKLAEKCDLMIHHGGYGSCQTGLYSGTPMVIIPTFSERESNARRIAALGAGEFVLPITDESGNKNADIGLFRREVHKVLTKPEYKKKAGFYSKHLKSFGGVKYTAEIIENFIKKQIKP